MSNVVTNDTEQDVATNRASDKLGVAPIQSLFFSMSVPIILGLLVGGLYNVVDAFFVTRALGADAMGGISIVFPLQMIVIAMASLIGTGTASIVARKLGAKSLLSAEQTAGCAIAIALLLGVVFALAGVFFIHDILAFMGVTPALLPYSLEYLQLILLATPVTLLNTTLMDTVRAEGKMQYVMLSMLLASITNIILDPIAIYLLEWGVLGVALATIFAQLCSFSFMLYVFFGGKTEVKIKLKFIHLKWQTVKDIIALGMPIFVNYFGVSVVIGLVNLSIANAALPESDFMISAYGLIGRIFMFLVFPLLGMMVAYQTICGYNYGAQQYNRVKEISVFAVKVTTLYCAICTGAILLFPHVILGIFTSDALLLKEGVDIAKYLFIGFVAAGASNIWPMYFQATGKAKQAFFLSSLRVYFLQIPLLMVVPALWGVHAIWLMFPVADAVTLIVSYLVIRVAYKKLDQWIQTSS